MSDTSSGRLEWIREVIDQHQSRLTRFATRITGDLETARDVVQDTFLRLLREDVEKTRDQPRLRHPRIKWLIRNGDPIATRRPRMISSS